MPNAQTNVLDPQTLPGVRVEEIENRPPVPTARSSTFKPLIVGASNGRVVAVENEAVVRGAGTTDALAYTGVTSLTRVGNSASISDYRVDADCQVHADGNKIEWLANTISPPVLANATVISGGALPAGDYYYVATYENAHGETIASNEVHLVLSATASVRMDIRNQDQLATDLNLYRGVTAGTEALLDTVDGYVSRYTDTGSATGVQTPPVTNTALREPDTAATYYVSYQYLTRTYPANTTTGEEATAYKDKAVYYTALSDVLRDHGIASDIGRSAQILMGGGDTGYSCQGIWVIAQDPDDIVSDYSAAHNHSITVAKTITADNLNIVPLISDDTVYRAWKAHCEEFITPENYKPRKVVSGPAATRPYGPVSTAGSTLAFVETLGKSQVCHYFANESLRVKVSNADGTTSWVTYPGWMAGVYYAGMRGQLISPMYYATGDELPTGVSVFDNSYVPLSDVAVLKALNAAGVMVLDWGYKPAGSSPGVVKLIHDQSLNTDYSELRETGALEIKFALNRDIQYDIAHASPKIVGAPYSDVLAAQAIDIANARISDYLRNQKIVTYSPDATTFTLDSRSASGTFYKLAFAYQSRLPVNVVTIQQSFMLVQLAA